MANWVRQIAVTAGVVLTTTCAGFAQDVSLPQQGELSSSSNAPAQLQSPIQSQSQGQSQEQTSNQPQAGGQTPSLVPSFIPSQATPTPGASTSSTPLSTPPANQPTGDVTLPASAPAQQLPAQMPVAAPDTDGAASPIVPSVINSPATPAAQNGAAAIDETLPHDLSPFGMFMQADWVVKSVMLLLLAASLVTWIILIAKTIELFLAKRRAQGAVRSVVASQSLAEAVDKAPTMSGVGACLVQAAVNEVRVSMSAVESAGNEGVKERVTSALSRVEVHAGRYMSRGTGILATIGSISPFVGLFGTVWGIMNSFIGISHSQTTNLAVVAPGIAEALLATACGLVAAIPAVVIYNYFARSIAGYRQILADVSAGIERLVSRDLDFHAVQAKAGHAQRTVAAE